MRLTIPLLLAPLLLTSSVALSGASRPHADEAVPPGAVRCIDPRRVTARRPERPNSVIFELAGGATFRNDLIGACPGVARSTKSSIVQTVVEGGSLCMNDSIRVFDPVEARGVGVRAFPRCRLGAFTPIPR